MKILIITNIPSPYRVDFFNYLQTQYSHSGYEFSILYASRAESNRRWIIDNSKLVNSFFLQSKTICIPQKMDNKYIHIPIKVKEKLSELKPDIIVCMEYNPTSIQAMHWCRKNKIPFISWTDGTPNSEKNINFLQKLSRRYIIKNADAFVASSTKSKEQQLYYGAKEDRIFISFLTEDVGCFQKTRRPKKHGQIVCVGSLIYRKGIDLLLDAVGKISEQYHLILAGDGPEKGRLEEQIKKLGLEERVTFAGFLNKEELCRLYAESEIFVLTTREDCFALVILEAIAAGLPVVCSRYADGVFDLIEDKKNGFIVNPYDKMEVAEALQMLLNSSELRTRMSENSKHMLERFAFDACAENFMKAVRLVEGDI